MLNAPRAGTVHSPHRASAAALRRALFLMFDIYRSRMQSRSRFRSSSRISHVSVSHIHDKKEHTHGMQLQLSLRAVTRVYIMTYMSSSFFQHVEL